MIEFWAKVAGGAGFILFWSAIVVLWLLPVEALNTHFLGGEIFMGGLLMTASVFLFWEDNS